MQINSKDVNELKKKSQKKCGSRANKSAARRVSKNVKRIKLAVMQYKLQLYASEQSAPHAKRRGGEREREGPMKRGSAALELAETFGLA